MRVEGRTTLYVLGGSLILLLLVLQLLNRDDSLEITQTEEDTTPPINLDHYYNYKPSQLRPPFTNVNRSEHWVVVTTINSPTEAILTLSKIPGWRVVVVADRFEFIQYHNRIDQTNSISSITNSNFPSNILTTTGRHHQIGL